MFFCLNFGKQLWFHIEGYFSWSKHFYYSYKKKKKVLVQKFFYWCRSLQEYRGLEHFLESWHLKNRKLLSYWPFSNLSLAMQSLLQLNNPCEKMLLPVLRYEQELSVFLIYEASDFITHCLQTCNEFINSISQTLYWLYYWYSVFRSYHFISTLHNHIAIGSQEIFRCEKCKTTY